MVFSLIQNCFLCLLPVFQSSLSSFFPWENKPPGGGCTIFWGVLYILGRFHSTKQYGILLHYFIKLPNTPRESSETPQNKYSQINTRYIFLFFTGHDPFLTINEPGKIKKFFLNGPEITPKCKLREIFFIFRSGCFCITQATGGIDTTIFHNFSQIFCNFFNISAVFSTTT